MDLSLFSAENYQWKLALIALITSLGIPALVTPLLRLIPAFRQTGQLNKAAATEPGIAHPRIPLGSALECEFGVLEIAGRFLSVDGQTQ